MNKVDDLVGRVLDGDDREWDEFMFDHGDDAMIEWLKTDDGKRALREWAAREVKEAEAHDV